MTYTIHATNLARQWESSTIEEHGSDCVGALYAVLARCGAVRHEFTLTEFRGRPLMSVVAYIPSEYVGWDRRVCLSTYATAEDVARYTI